MEGREGGGLVSARSPSNLKFKSKSTALEHLSVKWSRRHTAMSTRPAWHSDFLLDSCHCGHDYFKSNGN